ncbi:MAG TPA: nickel pincer cofactor biosynthesis protein LarB [Phycisphaerae bacterium]|nr:nickel pincer cofactor biosynthesis protein LarB [Phycisphaerae bacterium]HRY67223.1 nickel pincer cofactor biosynthesis protein LarB [Phycisphaerae bacterium]HSA26407.1 nickel pincer cofactor biosynthesis protein LarB [Phycisphaerae bacterium]
MDEAAIKNLLVDVRAKRRTVDQAVAQLRHLPFEDLGFAKVDHHRAIRCGFPEVIYCEGKTTEQIVAIAGKRLAGGGNLLATRANPNVARTVRRRFRKAIYNPTARTLTVRQQPPAPARAFVAVVCAGTSDLPVAEEARETCEIMDQPTRKFYDVGVAGIHRLLAHSAELQQAGAVVVCAGMEGALASVVGGLVCCPVIGVPTSIGYGASFGGIAPLLTMLNSCAAGVSVVNIDNGFGGGYIAALIARGAPPEAESGE